MKASAIWSTLTFKDIAQPTDAVAVYTLTGHWSMFPYPFPLFLAFPLPLFFGTLLLLEWLPHPAHSHTLILVMTRQLCILMTSTTYRDVVHFVPLSPPSKPNPVSIGQNLGWGHQINLYEVQVISATYRNYSEDIWTTRLLIQLCWQKFRMLFLLVLWSLLRK